MILISIIRCKTLICIMLTCINDMDTFISNVKTILSQLKLKDINIYLL